MNEPSKEKIGGRQSFLALGALRRLVIILLVPATIVLGTIIFQVLRPRDRLTWENFERIQLGMTRDQVERILGPPGDYSRGGGLYSGPGLIRTIGIARFAKEGELWWNDGPNIIVHFDSADKVEGIHIYNRWTLGSPETETFWAKARRWLGF
jgi:hypothetical protein